jgi:hypothetical protein
MKGRQEIIISWTESCTVPAVSVETTLRNCPSPIALVKSIVNVPYDECRCKAAVAKLDLRLLRGPDPKMNFSAVLVGLTSPPFHNLQF